LKSVPIVVWVSFLIEKGICSVYLQLGPETFRDLPDSQQVNPESGGNIEQGDINV
jgi:hypothetical protein